MKRKVVLSVAFLLAMVLTLSVLPFASAATKAQNGLQYELTTDKEAYTSGETIQVELKVANSNEQDLTVAYEVILPEGMELAAADRGYLQVAAGGQATSDFSVQAAAKGADELPSTGDSFPLEVVAVLLVLSAVGCAVFFKKTRFVAFMLLCVMLIGVVEPALVNVAAAETYPEDAYQVEYTEEISEEMHEKQLDEQELQLLGEQDDEFIDTVELDQFELSHNIVVDNQVVTIKVVGTVSVADATEEAANVKALGSVSLKPVTILGKTKFKLTWSKVPGATHYEVWHTSGSTYVKRATCVGTTWTTNYGVAGVINTYKVRAITKSGNTITAKGPYSTRTCYGMAQPTMSSVAHTSTNSEDVRVSWNKGSFCTGYYVYRSFTGATGSYSLIGKSTTTSFVDKYRNGYYKVRPYYTSSQTGITYSGPATGVKNMPTQYRALVIGQTYPNSSSALPGCGIDAAEMKNMLNHTAGPKYRAIDTDIVYDLNADEFQPAIKTAFQRAKANDVSLVYYTGHGAYFSSGSEYNGAWCSDDDYAIPASTIRSWLDAIPGKKIVIMDSCYSGNVIGKIYGEDLTIVPKGEFLENEAAVEDVVKEINDSFIGSFAKADTTDRANLAASNYYVLTASSGTQTSTEVSASWYGRRGGLFTIHMLYGSGWDHSDSTIVTSLYADQSPWGNGDNDISLKELYAYVVDAVDYATSGTSIYQDAQVYPTNSSQLLWGR